MIKKIVTYDEFWQVIRPSGPHGLQEKQVAVDPTKWNSEPLYLGEVDGIEYWRVPPPPVKWVSRHEWSLIVKSGRVIEPPPEHPEDHNCKGVVDGVQYCLVIPPRF